MESSSPAHVLVVVHDTGLTPGLLEAIHARVERGPCWFHVLIPMAAGRHGRDASQRLMDRTVALVEEAAHRPVDGEVSRRHDPMDAIEETLRRDEFDEIILSTPMHGLARSLHLDLPHRVAHLGLPLTTVAPPGGGA